MSGQQAAVVSLVLLLVVLGVASCRGRIGAFVWTGSQLAAGTGGVGLKDVSPDGHFSFLSLLEGS